MPYVYKDAIKESRECGVGLSMTSAVSITTASLFLVLWRMVAIMARERSYT